MARPRITYEDATMLVAFRIPTADVEWLDELAAAHQLTRSEVLRQLVTNGKARHKQNLWRPRRSSGAA